MQENEVKNTESAETTSTETVTHCPRCGRSIYEGYVKVSEDVMKDYTRSLLGQRRFSKTIELLEGNLRITFEALGADQSELIAVHAKDMTLDKILDLKLLATLSNVQVIDPVMHETTDKYTASYEDRVAYCKTVPESMAAVLKDIDAPLMGIIRKCALSFDVLCAALKEQVFNSDFYEGIGLL